MMRRSCSVAAALVTVAFAITADAEPAVLTTRPFPDLDANEVTFFIGGINDSGRSLKASTLEIVIDGQHTGAPASTQSLSDWATTAAEANQAWRPPVSVGLVYLWIDGVPASVLDGIQAFFQRVPSRTPVYPTIYGRMRQGRARLTAADVSRLGDVAYLDGNRPNMVEAIRLDLPDLAADPAALKLLLFITDGRDFADPKGEGPGDFAALGREIRKANITPIVVAFPPPEADGAQAAANLRDLHEAAGGFLRSIDQVQDIENTLESLGQAVADLQRVRIATPWTWRAFGGDHRLSVRLTTSDGQRLTVDVGSIAVGSGRLWLIAVVLALGFLVVVVGAVIVVKRSHDLGETDLGGDDALLSAAHELIRRGASPRRAVEELKRAHSGSMQALVVLDPEAFSDPRFPYFRTRPGRMRMQEISDLLAKTAADRPALGDGLADMLAQAVEDRIPAEKAAETLAGRVPADELAAFAGLDLEQLAEALRTAARNHSVLGTPRARGAAVSVQDALRSSGGTRGIAVGWLVRAGGPGPRGETLRLGPTRTVMGRGSECAIRIAEDLDMAASHAEFSIDGGEFVVVPLEGHVGVEGKQVEGRRVLTDGETLAIGGGLFVFKSARAGNLVGATTGPTPPLTLGRHSR